MATTTKLHELVSSWCRDRAHLCCGERWWYGIIAILYIFTIFGVNYFFWRR